EAPYFIEAEDGIVDFHVTGVQTCALPICRSTRPGCESPPAAPELPVRPNRTGGGAPTIEPATPSGRSTRPGCECPPAAPSLSARPNRTEGGAPTECARQTDIRCRGTRPGCEYPPAAPKLPARPNRTGGGAPTECARQTDISL